MTLAYPWTKCGLSMGQIYVRKSIADIAIEDHSHKAVLHDTQANTYTCGTIDWQEIVDIPAEDIDSRGILDSGKTTCAECQEEWEN